MMEMEVDARVFISNNQNAEDSKTERERESVCVCETQCVAETSQLEETFGDGHVQLISESFQMLLMTCFP